MEKLFYGESGGEMKIVFFLRHVRMFEVSDR